MFSLCDYCDYCSSIERPPNNINNILTVISCGPMHRIRLLGLLIFLYYTTFVAIRKVRELDKPVAKDGGGGDGEKMQKKKRLTIGGSAAGAVEEVKGYQLPERDRIVYHHYLPYPFRC